jgi:hypothetical protein
MLDNVAAVALAKAKVLALITASLAAGGVGGAVALSHAAPSSPMVRDVAATSTTEDPETGDAAVDPETADAQDPETGDANEDPAYTLPECPADVKNHGAYDSSGATEAPKGKDGAHGSFVSEAAKSDCGKTAGDDAEDPETDDATDTESQDPETEDAQDPETGDATDTDGGSDADTAPVKTTKVKEHGHGASSWSSNGHGKNNG